ncbi:MAG: hypothetical protein V1897_15855 [Pseudomonadota bacterium]
MTISTGVRSLDSQRPFTILLFLCATLSHVDYKSKSDGRNRVTMG